ncbi:MAG: hypothetical protein LBF84_02645 [Holosporales bacterium]|jgi:hypothetical protein|nr:hypothetical protein [Holosporales bacterium]
MNIPLVREGEESDLSGISKATREWVIFITLGGEPVELEVFGFRHGSSRHTVGFSVNQYLAGADTRFSDLGVLLQLDQYAPLFEQQFATGGLFAVIVIKRFAWINGELKVTEEHTFSTCYIVKYIQILDYIFLSIRVCQKVEKFIIIDQDGNNGGSVVSSASTVTGAFSTGT